MLKMSWGLVILFVVNSVFAAKTSEQSRREKILSVINEELSEVSRLARQQQRNPEVYMRMAELNLEKARLQREAENEKFLSLDIDQRRKANERAYYANSRKSFETANQYANAVVKRFPNYKDIADVYYILAYNARELKQYDEAQKFFSIANKKANKGSATFAKSQLALADSLFNNSDFKQAIPLYEDSLKKLDETWWTKDAFNLAWCYYRMKDFDKAIEKMHEVYARSKKSKYVNMSYYVERDLGIFYIDARRTEDAIAWYKSNGIDFTGQLIKIARTLIPQGRFTQAEQLLEEAERLQRNPEDRKMVYLLELELFDKYGKVPPHLEASKELTKLALGNRINADERKLLEYQVAKKAAELQKGASDEIYADVKSTRELRASQAREYFELLAQLRPGKTAEPNFYKGETAFAAKQYSQAIEAYQEAYASAINEKNSKIKSQSLEGMLAALGQLPTAQAEKWYVPVYTAYLEHDRSSARGNSISKKLYKVYIDKKDYAAADKVLQDYAKTNPGDFKTQEAMLAGLMENARKRKDHAAVKAYVGQINNGTYKVSQKYAQALRQVVTSMQIEGAQIALDKGDKSSALKSYLRIYHNPESTKNAKANAAYNLAALYYEAGDPNESYKWAVTAIQEMDAPEAQKFNDSFLAISTNLFLRQRFTQSADLSLRVLAKLCSQSAGTKNTAFKNAAFLWLSEGKIDKAEQTLALGQKCGVDPSSANEVRLELAKEYSDQKRWDSLEKTIEPVLTSKTHAPQAIPFLNALKNSYSGVGDQAGAQKAASEIQKIYRDSKSQRIDIPVESLDIIAFGMMSGLEQKSRQLEQVKLAFPEQNFNTTVKRKLAMLDSLTADVTEIQKTGSGRGIVRAYKSLISTYEKFAFELRDFTPEGKSAEYLESFRKAMSSVWTPILQTAQGRRREISEIIHKNGILSQDSNALLTQQGQDIVPVYRMSQSMVLMDRGGVR